MLSDEEKKALYMISLRRKGIPPNGGFIADNEEITIILNLIEKQSKEIEELKQEKEYLNCIIESDNDNYINKDKIKAKIEEIRKTHAPEDDYAESQIYILQSLLEKE